MMAAVQRMASAPSSNVNFSAQSQSESGSSTHNDSNGNAQLDQAVDVSLTNTSNKNTRTGTLPTHEYADLLHTSPHFGDFRDDLREKGYAVVKSAIPRAKALEYRERAFEWLEKHEFGFKKDDKSTWEPEYLPATWKGGMFAGGAYCFGQQQWVWDIRCEPGVTDAFATLWGTDELQCSFDGGSLMLPGHGPSKDDPTSSWQHIDLNPSREGFYVAQGLVNLNENGPDDGGLLVMEGSSKLMKEFFDQRGRPEIPEKGIDDTFLFTMEEKQWFLDRGCKWIKVCAEPGDLILWDSACMHMNEPPTGHRDRMVTYVCMGPSHLVTEHDKKVRDLAFQLGDGTSHPVFHTAYSLPRPAFNRPETGRPCPKFTNSVDPVRPNEKVLRLAGIIPYN